MSHDHLIRRDRFTGKTVVVTGGGTGIGKRIARDLYDEGAYVHILGRRGEKLLEAKREASTKSAPFDEDRFFCHEADVSDGRWVKEVFDSIRDLTGPAWGLVTCAAINPSRKGITDTEIDDWRETLEVNLTGVFNCCKAAVQQMLALGGGSIVNVSSVGGAEGLPDPDLLQRLQVRGRRPHRVHRPRLRPGEDPGERRLSRLRRHGADGSPLREDGGGGVCGPGGGPRHGEAREA